MLNIDLESRIESCILGFLHSAVEYSAEYGPGGPNIELYIRSLNIVMNIDVESRI